MRPRSTIPRVRRRSTPPPWLAPVLFVAAYALIALAWAMTQPPLPSGDGALDGALRRARLGELAPWLLCVALATALTWRPATGSLSLAGLALALTPAVVFLGGAGGDDGLAIAAAIALAAGLLRVLVGAGADATAAGARAGGAAVRGATAAGARGRPPAWAWAATVLAAALLLLSGPRTDYPLGSLGDALRAAGPALASASGRFATPEVALPPLGFVVWAIALLALVLAADRLTDDRGRRALWSVAIGGAVLVPLLYAAARSGAGSGLAARQPLALLAPLPLLAGALLARAGATWWPRLGAACFGLLALVQLLGFLAAHEARGAGASPWLAAVLLGGAALAAAGALVPAAAAAPTPSPGPTAGTPG